MKFVYIANIENVDVMVALHVMQNLGYLDYFVCYPKPKTDLGKDRLKTLKRMGVKVKHNISSRSKYIIVGTSLTLVSKFIKRDNHINTLVITGGFVGSNIYPIKNENGDDCIFSKSCNFNLDVTATTSVLKSERYSIGEVILIGKNVYNSERNTPRDLWNTTSMHEIFDMYGVSDTKKQYGLLTVWDAIQLLLDGNTKCEYTRVHPQVDFIEGEVTKWGSMREYTGFRDVLAAVRIK